METLKNVGKIITIDNLIDGKGMRVAREFLNRLKLEFAKQSANYINITGEAPFAWSERQLISIIAPSLANISKAFLAEHPINRRKYIRKEDENDYTGYLDYWCRYSNSDNRNFWDFIIEVKHSFDAYNNDIITKESKDRWHYMNKFQIKMSRHAAKEFSQECEGVIPLAMQVIPISENVRENHEPKSKDEHGELNKILKRYHNSLSPSPNFSSVFILHDNLFKESAFKYSDSHTDYYPGVMLIFKVHETTLFKK